MKQDIDTSVLWVNNKATMVTLDYSLEVEQPEGSQKTPETRYSELRAELQSWRTNVAWLRDFLAERLAFTHAVSNPFEWKTGLICFPLVRAQAPRARRA